MIFREFAIVILHALCSASDQVCYVVAAESPAIDNLVAFLEMGDANMHQIAQQHGIQALRENPEVMGTSVPMLRRSASILQQLCRMDSKVGQIITEVLFAMQLAEQSEAESGSKSSNNKNAEKEKQSIQEEASPEQKSADTAQKSSEKTNGDTAPAKGDSQDSTDTVEQPQNTRKRPAAHNGVPKVVVENADSNGEDGDAADGTTAENEEELKKTAEKDSMLAPVTKKPRLENGLVNHVITTSNKNNSSTSNSSSSSSNSSNSSSNSSTSAGKPLVNGDLKPTVDAMQNASKSTAAAAAATTPTGSVQAVA
ncbi:unnamed protein product [Gongylonema pulchrum]|uniref:BAF250_C domain-containing protein n=1 Tax=Gongylonema pulchrum TaxID=637853 RepID=A0A183EDH7_9BILA|nr:unnamed protein product [Gongylonema pulchrum]